MKLEENRKIFMEANPDDFPVHNLSGNFGDDFKSIWELDKSFIFNLEEIIGHSLQIKNSKIEHQGIQYNNQLRFWFWCIC